MRFSELVPGDIVWLYQTNQVYLERAIFRGFTGYSGPMATMVLQVGSESRTYQLSNLYGSCSELRIGLWCFTDPTELIGYLDAGLRGYCGDETTETVLRRILQITKCIRDLEKYEKFQNMGDSCSS